MKKYLIFYIFHIVFFLIILSIIGNYNIIGHDSLYLFYYGIIYAAIVLVTVIFLCLIFQQLFALRNKGFFIVNFIICIIIFYAVFKESVNYSVLNGFKDKDYSLLSLYFSFLSSILFAFLFTKGSSLKK